MIRKTNITQQTDRMLSRAMTLATICRRSDGTIKTQTSPVLSRHSKSSSTYDSSKRRHTEMLRPRC